MRKIAENLQDCEPFGCVPGDTIQLTYTPDLAARVSGFKEQVLMSEEFKKPMVINRVGIVWFEDDFGCKEGVLGVFGTKK